MNRIKTYLFAIIALMGITAALTSCQKDAPVINYTMNVTVTNDVKKVAVSVLAHRIILSPQGKTAFGSNEEYIDDLVRRCPVPGMSVK